MSTLKIQQALETRLATMSPALATVAENVDYTPTTGTPYQRLTMVTGEPDNSSIGQRHYIEVGVFMVTLCYPKNTGANACRTRAESVRTLFKRGTTLTIDGIRIIVPRTPKVSTGYVDGDRFCIPVTITYEADIFN